MNRLTKKVLTIATIVAAFVAIGIAGNIDRTEQIVYTMPQEAYEEIYLKLGNNCSDGAIANEYINNREYYDSLSNR